MVLYIVIKQFYSMLYWFISTKYSIQFLTEVDCLLFEKNVEDMIIHGHILVQDIYAEMNKVLCHIHSVKPEAAGLGDYGKKGK